MVIHSSILAWGIPWTEQPGGLQSMRSQKFKQDRVTNYFHLNIEVVEFLLGKVISCNISD